MKSYRDYLDSRGVPAGPWIVDGPRLTAPKEPQRRKGAA
jgi:hypothetical protein